MQYTFPAEVRSSPFVLLLSFFDVHWLVAELAISLLVMAEPVSLRSLGTVCRRATCASFFGVLEPIGASEKNDGHY